MAFTFFGPAFQRVRLASGLITLLARSYNPRVQAPWFGLFRFRSPLLSESRLIYFPPGTEMVHFPGLARTRLCIQRVVARFCRAGFPHSDIPGSKPVCGFPGLIAAYHVLHRLLAPRHSPYALSSLTIRNSNLRASRGWRSCSPDLQTCVSFMHTACVWSEKLPFARYSVVKDHSGGNRPAESSGGRGALSPGPPWLTHSRGPNTPL